MLRDCNTLVSNISVQLLNRDTGKMVRSALRTAAVALQSRCYFKVAGNTKQSVLRLVHPWGSLKRKVFVKRGFSIVFLKCKSGSIYAYV